MQMNEVNQDYNIQEYLNNNSGRFHSQNPSNASINLTYATQFNPAQPAFEEEKDQDAADPNSSLPHLYYQTEMEGPQPVQVKKKLKTQREQAKEALGLSPLQQQRKYQ